MYLSVDCAAVAAADTVRRCRPCFVGGPYRFFFYASDRHEPAHVHVERDDHVAKFWLEPIRLRWSGGFGATELRRIHRLIDRYRGDLLRSWDEYFGE